MISAGTWPILLATFSIEMWRLSSWFWMSCFLSCSIVSSEICGIMNVEILNVCAWQRVWRMAMRRCSDGCWWLTLLWMRIDLHKRPSLVFNDMWSATNLALVLNWTALILSSFATEILSLCLLVRTAIYFGISVIELLKWYLIISQLLHPSLPISTLLSEHDMNKG